MSRRRRTLPAVTAVAGASLFALCACNPTTTSSAASATTSTSTGSAAATATTSPANSPVTIPGSATPSPTTPAWKLSIPNTINGEQRLTNPTAQTQTELQQGIQKAEQYAGITTGTVVSGIYNDPADDAWLVVIGVNGSDFNSTHLVTSVKDSQPGVAIGDAASTSIAEPATAGPHGGTALCQQTSMTIDTVDGAISSQTGTCYWMTPTTFGVVSLITKVGSPITAFFISAAKVNSIMQYVRPAVESQQ